MRSLALGLLVVTLAASAQVSLAALTGAWLNGASPATLRPAPTKRFGGKCVCAPDPILPDPRCILCLCDTEKVQDSNYTMPSSMSVASQRPTNAGQCGGLAGSKVTKMTYTATGASYTCRCLKDPILKAPQWIMCKCPLKTKPTGNPFGVPTTAVYTNWPAPTQVSPPVSEWLRCKTRRFALCSMANCTMVYKGRKSTTIPMAECGCITAGPNNNLTALSLVDPIYILDQKAYKQTKAKCPNNADSKTCGKVNSSPVCKAIAKNTIYGGKYDFVSTYEPSPGLGGFSKLCVRPRGGYFAQCMTAACYKRKAWDGSPVTCYCPVYKSKKYLLGAPKGIKPSCGPNFPYVLSGAAADFSG